MFPIEEFWEHVGIVFTKYFIIKKQNPSKIKNDRSEGIKEKMKGLVDLNEIDKESKEEVNRMIGWIYNFEPLDTIKMREIDNKIMEKKDK